MAVVYVGSFPFDPELELKNFKAKQAEYEAAYRRTRDPLVLHEALLNAKAAGQLTPDWLMEALSDNLRRGRTKRTAERFQDRMRHVQRYRCVRDLRQKLGELGSKDCALDLAVEQFAAKGDTTARSTIKDSYDRVSRDLNRLGRDSKYYHLVVQSDPTVVPVCVSRTQSGEVLVNGEALRSSGG